MMHEDLSKDLQEFIQQQQLFFTATAPKEGRINLSPKGLDSFRCLDSKSVMYLDLTGSGNETAAHIFEDGRLTIMFCSFKDKPLILRLYGKGEVISRKSPEWQELSAEFPDYPAARQIIRLNIESVQTSCGYGIPKYELQKDRDTLLKWGEKRSEADIQEYWKEKNMKTIDGIDTHLEY